MGEYDELQRQQEQHRRNLQRIEEEQQVCAAGVVVEPGTVGADNAGGADRA